MAKREKYSIWGREPDTKKGCYQFYQNKKKSWPLNYVLNTTETQHMIDMMSKYYYSPMNPELVQDKWKKVKDKILTIIGDNNKRRCLVFLNLFIKIFN